nr:mechanosensitive ion channel [Bacteroides sp.]
MIPCEIIPSHTVAVWMMRHINQLLGWVGLQNNMLAIQIVYVAAVVAAGYLLGMVVRLAVVYAARKVVHVRHSTMAQEILNQHVLEHCSHVIPPLVIMALIPIALSSSPLSTWLMRIVVVYTIITFVIAINAILKLIWNRYNEHDNTRNLPLKGILITVEGILWLIALIIAVSVIVDKSPTTLLAGLGAFAAALMLIFKDSILGFTAGIQLALNDMVHVGDWIVVPSTPANGTVIDVSLTTVKIQNFDNTIITCPPYTLVSTSFQNWRGMTQSGCRRIARNVIFEFSSVKPVTQDQVSAIAEKLPLLQGFVKQAQPTPTFDPGTAVVNGTIDTNLGLFRAYMCQYILTQPQFNHDAQVLVRVMDPSNYGMTVQIYCFTATTAWTAYEAIQSALFEHITAIAPIFGLVIYNSPSSTDIDQIQVLDENGMPARVAAPAVSEGPKE